MALAQQGFRVQKLLLAALSALVFTAASAPVEAADTPTIALEQIRTGMKGYGLTVIKGTRPERFDVEVVGVVKNFHGLPGLILVKVSHPRLDIVKNVKGMSGSPIYLEGKLAGAYAYSPASFQVEPVAGVTPIAPMLAEMRRPIPEGFWPLDPRAKSEGGTASLTPGHWSFEEASAGARARHASPEGFVPAGTAMSASGLGPRSLAYANELLRAGGYETLMDGGNAATATDAPNVDAPMHFESGSAIGVSYVRGDISMSGIGTVTHVEGNKLCAFGHPMMQAGNTAFPTGIADIVWIYASAQHSFKMGNIVRPLGALVQDRLSAIVIDEKAKAPEFPMQVNVTGAVGAPKTRWDMTVTEDSFMGPMIVASALSNVIESTVPERRDVSWKLSTKVTLDNYGEVTLQDVGIAIGGMPEGDMLARSKLVRLIGEALNNPWEHLHIKSVSATFDVKYADDVWRLREVEALDTEVQPGAPVRLRMHMEQKFGPRFSKDITVSAPTDVSDKDVDFEVLPGYGVKFDADDPENMRELIGVIRGTEVSPRTVVVQRAAGGAGILHRDMKTEVLPGFALDALRSDRRTDMPKTYPVLLREVFPLEKYIVGRGRVSVRVRSKKS